MIRKVYAEITNICNLSCSFCHGTKREKKFITLSEFEHTAKEASKITEYIYLHLMGEPLLHPKLKEILEICEKYSLKATVTTNGTLLNEKEEILLNSKALYKLCISVHSFEANESENFEKYINQCCVTGEKLSKNNVIVTYRLWNEGGKNSLNEKIISYIKNYFQLELITNRKGLTIKKNMFIELGTKFNWPDNHNDIIDDNCFCYGLRDQIGILCDGTVVPCCLDADGSIPLGNIHKNELNEIINSSKAKEIYNGFTNRKAINDLCKKCSYARRFKGE